MNLFLQLVLLHLVPGVQSSPIIFYFANKIAQIEKDKLFFNPNYSELTYACSFVDWLRGNTPKIPDWYIYEKYKGFKRELER